MPTRLDLLHRVLSEYTGAPLTYFHGSVKAMEAKFGVKATQSAEVTPEEEAVLLADLRANMPQIIAEILSVKGWGLSPEDSSLINNYALKEAQESRPKSPYRRLDRASLQSIGEFWWRHTYAKYPGDDLASSRGAFAYLKELEKTEPERAYRDRLFLGTHEGSFLIMASSSWADHGFPVVQMGHKYAAALMATAIPDLPINAPWPAFYLEVPRGLLHTKSLGGTRCDIYGILVAQHMHLTLGTAWSFVAFSDGAGAESPDLHRYSQPLSALLEKQLKVQEGPQYPFDLPLDTQDDRTLLMLTRLVLNTCLAMSDPRLVKGVGKQASARGASSRGSPIPTARIFKVGMPVTIDCREELKAFLSGAKRDPLSVQFMVRGHWRNQAHGQGMQEHRLTWIEPYWKGPEDSPILKRSHQLPG